MMGRSASLWAVLLALMVGVPAGAQDNAPLVTATPRGAALRWAWPTGARPRGYVVERREGEGAWVRLTARPVERLRDRAAARALLGTDFDRYADMLFPDDPAAEAADPETMRSLQLLAADLSPGVATALGLRFDDTTAALGGAYQYRLIAVGAEGERVVGTSARVVAGRATPAEGPAELRAAQEPNGVALRWAPNPRFSGYHVDRRRGGEERRVSETPVVVFVEAAGTTTESAPTFFRDTAVSVGDSLVYRVRGVDPFGRLSEPSAPAGLTVRDLTAPAPPAAFTSAVLGDTVVLRWSASPDADVATYQVWRAPSRDGPFTPVGAALAATARELRDAGRPGGVEQWYRVIARDRAGLESAPSATVRAEVPDLTPPPAPDSVIGRADTGLVRLTWRAAPGPDVRGYRVYRASRPTAVYGLLTPTPVAVPAFHDSVPRGADHAFYYRVAAVDSAFNESAPSVVVSVTPPDVVPPSAPRITAVAPGEGRVTVRWARSPEPDVTGYVLLVRPRGDTGWAERPVRPGGRDLVDSVVRLTPRRRYELSLIAVDDAGNRSPPAPPVVAEPYQRTPPPALEIRRARFDAARSAVTLEWSLPGGAGIGVEILRREERGPITRVAALRDGRTTFEDRPVVRGRTYEYAVRAVDAHGNAAEPRRWVRVRTGRAR